MRENAAAIGVHKSTVSRELKRYREAGKYRAAVVQEIAEIRRARFALPRKLTPGIEGKIRRAVEGKQWAPEQIAGYYRRSGTLFVGKTTIYSYLLEDKVNGYAIHAHSATRCATGNVGSPPRR